MSIANMTPKGQRQCLATVQQLLDANVLARSDGKLNFNWNQTISAKLSIDFTIGEFVGEGGEVIPITNSPIVIPDLSAPDVTRSRQWGFPS